MSPLFSSSSYDCMILSRMNVSIFMTIMGKVHVNSKALSHGLQTPTASCGAASGAGFTHGRSATRRSFIGEFSAQ